MVITDILVLWFLELINPVFFSLLVPTLHTIAYTGFKFNTQKEYTSQQQSFTENHISCTKKEFVQIQN